MNNDFVIRLFSHFRENILIKEVPQNTVLCDIGCAEHARFLKNLKGKIRKGIGIDPKVDESRDDKLILINQKLHKKIPLKSNSVDVFTLSAVLEHVEYPQEIVNEMYRVLRKGGKVVMTTPSKIAKPVLETLVFLKLLDSKEIIDHQNYFSKKELNTILKKAKFNSIKVKYFEFGFNTLTLAYK